MPIRFPQEAGLRDARRLIIRPFTERDVDAVHEFFQRLPESVKRFAWVRIDQRSVTEEWAANLDHDRAVPVLALDGTKVVGEAALLYRQGGPLRLVGRIRWFLDPEYRGVGLGTVLIENFITMARENGLRHLTCMLITELEQDAIKTLESLGFKKHMLEGYGTDPDGNPADMVKMVLAL